MKIKLFPFLIFIVVVLIGAVLWYYQKNIYSKEALKLEILGPETCGGGEEVEYTLKYKNNGDVRLEEPELIFEYAEGSLPIDRDSSRVVIPLEDIYPGQEQILTFKARVFGREGETKTTKAILSYRPKSLRPFYESESTHSIRIEDVALTFVFDLPSKISSEKQADFSLNYFSSLDYPLSDLGIRIEYPSHFEFLSAKPSGIENNEWQINTLNKSEGGRIDISGAIYGDIGEQKIFKAQFGIWIKDKFIILKEITRGVEIVKPRLILDQRINGLSEYIATPGELLHYEIIFRNIGSEFFEKLFLVLELEGPFDFEDLNLSNGRINVSDKSILWDWRDISELRFLGPGEEGRVEFWITLKEEREDGVSQGDESYLKNRVALSQIREEFVTKLNSKLEIVQKAYYEEEVFGNSGPIPPKVAEKTTYTIIWQAKNHYNDVNGVKVSAVLPIGVDLTSNIFPEEEKDNFTYDSVSREIVWQIGDLEAGAGYSSPQKSIAFQIEFEPIENQRGLVATLINEAKISGDDQFTEIGLESAGEVIDTTLPDDDTVSEEQGIVQ